MNELKKIESFRKDLAISQTIEEVNLHETSAAAMAQFAKANKISFDQQNELGEFRLEIEAKKGILLDEMFPKGGDGSNQYNNELKSSSTTLADANITKDESSRARDIANTEEEDLQEIIDEIKEGGHVVTPNKVNKIIKDKKRKEKKDAKKQEVIDNRVEVEVPTNIINGDALEILETLEDKSIDIILTDPPYGINYKSNRSKYDDTITKKGLMNDGNEAFKLLNDTCKVLDRKIADNSHLYFFCSWSVFSQFESIIGKYFTIKTPIVWDKGNKGSGDLENDWGNQTEIIIYAVRGKKFINKRRGNIISVPRLSTVNMIHPTQKPIELIKQILEVSATEGDFIVDPFMGSGSTIKACNEIGLQSLGIELDEEVFKTAV